MSEKPKFVYVTFIAAPQDKVWHALTDAKATARYLSGFHVATDLKTGGASLPEGRAGAQPRHRAGV